MPDLENMSSDVEFVEMAKRASALVDSLGECDFDKLHEELSRMGMPLSQNPTMSQCSEELGRIQALKDRATAVAMLATRRIETYEGVVSLLRKVAVKVSQEKSADRREADAESRLAQFVMGMVKAKALHACAMLCAKNLDRQHDTVKEQLICFSLELKNRDYRGGFKPFQGSSLEPEAGQNSSHIADNSSWDQV